MSAYLNLRLPSRQLILDEVNAVNSTGLRMNQVIYGIPKPIHVAGENNTEIEIAARPGGLAFGDINFQYKRLHLRELFNTLGELHIPWPGLPHTQPANTHRLIPQLNERYGLALSNEDVLFEKIIGQVNEWVVKAAPESIAWIGQVKVVFGEGKIDLNDAWKINVLPGLEYPAPYDEARGFLQILSYGVDATPFADDLLALSVGRPFQTVLDDWEVGSHLFDMDWVSHPTPSENNIYGARLVYMGPPKAPYSTGRASSFTHLAVFEPSSFCTGWSGLMLLHFNVPV